MTYYERNLPHWQPERANIFVTWRLYGSLPAEVVARLKLEETGPRRQFALAETFLENTRSGPLWLRDVRVAECIEASLHRGDQELNHYRLLAYVVMPNHVHLLIEPRIALQRVTNGLKGATARRANQILGPTGQPFWQDESYDHWVRGSVELGKTVSYIENNPVKAKLVTRPEEWKWSSAACRPGGDRG